MLDRGEGRAAYADAGRIFPKLGIADVELAIAKEQDGAAARDAADDDVLDMESAAREEPYSRTAAGGWRAVNGEPADDDVVGRAGGDGNSLIVSGGHGNPGMDSGRRIRATALLIATVPKPPESSATISPPGSVLASAAENDRQGAAREQRFASLPYVATKVRGAASAESAIEQAMVRKARVEVFMRFSRR